VNWAKLITCKRTILTQEGQPLDDGHFRGRIAVHRKAPVSPNDITPYRATRKEFLGGTANTPLKVHAEDTGGTGAVPGDPRDR
jgi:hypothetical protein